MYRGTTPTLQFYLDFLLEDEKEVFITFEQNNKTVLEKSIAEIGKSVADNGNTILSFKMTQKETLLFDEETIEMQIRIKFENGEAIASNIFKTYINDILKGGEI